MRCAFPCRECPARVTFPKPCYPPRFAILWLGVQMLNQDGFDDEDPLRPARGIVNALLIALPLWLAAIAVFWLAWHYLP